jgi:hypothetical protein
MQDILACKKPYPLCAARVGRTDIQTILLPAFTSSGEPAQKSIRNYGNFIHIWDIYPPHGQHSKFILVNILFTFRLCRLTTYV